MKMKNIRVGNMLVINHHKDFVDGTHCVVLAKHREETLVTVRIEGKEEIKIAPRYLDDRENHMGEQAAYNLRNYV